MSEHERDESSFVGHEPCPNCGSRDNLARYASGRGHCHGCGHNEFPDDDDRPRERRFGHPRNTMIEPYDPIPGELGGDDVTKAYGLKTETRREAGISIVQMGVTHLGVEYPRKACICFDIRRPDGSLWGQKVRYKFPKDAEDDKTFRMPHAKGNEPTPMYMMHRWTQGTDRRTLVIWEGEGDCGAYLEVTGFKYAAVSLPKGAKAAEETIRDWYEWIDQFEKVVLCFDADATGREWVQKAAAILPPGKAYIGEVPGYKDARSALLANDVKAIQAAFWNAEPFKPDGITTSSEVLRGQRQRRKAQLLATVTYPWHALQAVLRGMKEASLITWTAGSGIGKSTIVRHIAHHVHKHHPDNRVGMLMLEEDKDETLDGFIGLEIGKNLLLDPELCTDEEHQAAAEALGLDDPMRGVVFYDHFGSTEVDNICSRIRFMAKALGCKVIVLDHISIMVSGTDTGDERKLIDVAMTKLRTLVQETKIILHVVVHLKRPQGDKGHEDGATVHLGQLRGSHSIAQLSDTCIAAQKDPDDPHGNYLDLVVLKNRKVGKKGPAGRLLYNIETGTLSEVSPEEKTTGFDPYTDEDAKALGI